jgi:hypothetical protein
MNGSSAHKPVQLGITDVLSLVGGMIAWQASGRPLIDQ